MNFSRQALLGIGMIIGGSVMLYAMVQQIGASNDQVATPAIVNSLTTEQVSTPPLTTDIDTEKRILAQKQKERAVRVAEQERRAKQFLAEQETAEAKALAKARAENERYVANTAPVESEPLQVVQNPIIVPQTQPNVDNSVSATSSINKEAQKAVQAQEDAKQAENKRVTDSKKRAEADAKKIENERKQQADAKASAEAAQRASAQAVAQSAPQYAPRSPTDYTVKRGDGLIKLAREYNIPVEALAQANNTSPSAVLQLGQTLTIPSRSQIQRLEREMTTAKLAREEKIKQEEALAKKSTEAKLDAQQKLREARTEVKETDAKGSFGVQVALATNQASADEVAKKFKAAGYQVKTSSTSRGVRVIVGPERGKVAALALKDKVNSDPSVNTTSAWVLYWR